MRRRLLPVVVLLVMAAVIAPETRSADEDLRGWASAYAPGVFENVISYRLETGLWRNIPPSRWIYADGYIATNDCSQIGLMLTLTAPNDQEYEVLVGDCGGDDGGSRWMTENNIIAELDWQLWQQLTALHGRPLEVGLR